MIAYYTFPRIGTGKDNDAYRPDVPDGFTSWSIVKESDTEFVVEVEGSDDYHGAVSGEPIAKEEQDYEVISLDKQAVIDALAAADKDATSISIQTTKPVEGSKRLVDSKGEVVESVDVVLKVKRP